MFCFIPVVQLVQERELAAFVENVKKLRALGEAPAQGEAQTIAKSAFSWWSLQYPLVN